MKIYHIKKTKQLIKKLKPYWKQLQEILNESNKKIYALEQKMSKDCGINDMEFFMCDNDYVGIGNVERTMKLINDKELENE